MNVNEFLGNREQAVKALTGSHNYNLNTAGSDKDYKYFVFPTFNDLYAGKMFSNSVVSPELDATCHDVRQLVDLVWKANVNFIEVLFSTSVHYDNAFAFMFGNREAYATMNLHTFFKATYGMHLMKMKDLHKGTAETTKLVEKFGYDTKQACHALRCLWTISRFMNCKNMGEALWFGENEPKRETLINLKEGKFTEEEFLKKVETWHYFWKDKAEKFYRETEPNEELYHEAQARVRDAVKEHLFPS
jgi:predicted nucleotidyltransferase